MSDESGTMQIVLMSAVVLVASALASAQTPKVYPIPAAPTWTPTGCRQVPFVDPTTPSGAIWGNLHGNGINADAVDHALAPQFVEAWTAEPATYNVTGPVFDHDGHLYFAPLLPYEDVVLISIDATTGARRWAIPGTGARPGSGTPLVLRDPVGGGDVIYLVLRDRALAVRADGSIVWDVPTGLALVPSTFDNGVLGTNYVPTIDAIVGLAKTGHLILLDRTTGASLVNTPYDLPGERTPIGTPIALPPATVAAAEDLLQTLVDVPDGGLQQLVSVLLGNDTEVGNMFSVDPWTGRLWVAATAPDAEDGTVDGVSQLGALFRLELVPAGSGYDVVEVCHRSFAGGSASTPTLSADGSRIYLGDNFGKLLAVRDDCTDAWELDLGSQIFGSVSVPYDNAEIFASTSAGIAKVTDAGTAGILAWSATIDPFENLLPGHTNFNLNLVTTAANGLAFQAGAGIVATTNLPAGAGIGVGLLDRDTGAIRAFAAGGEETVAVMSVGPDGALYLGNSPVRRLFSQVLGLSAPAIRGGVTKFIPVRNDLLVRDAVCAGALRATHARPNVPICPDSAEADRRQLQVLVDQAQAALGTALVDGDVTPVDASRLGTLLDKADLALGLADTDPTKLARSLGRGRGRLRRLCRKLD